MSGIRLSQRLIVVLFAGIFAAPANAQDDHYPLHLELEARAGDASELMQGRVFLPLNYQNNQLLFADIRGLFNDESGSEGNFGLGHRKLLDSGWIRGLYGFYDLKSSSNNNTFQQATLGAELMSVDWDFRVNGYLPENRAYLLGNSEAHISGSTLVVRQGEERAYYGGDFEIGKLVHAADQGNLFGNHEIRTFVGGFHFGNDTAGYENITGPRARTELRIYDLQWLGLESRISLAGQYEYDDVRGSNGTAIFNVRIPIGRRRNGRTQLGPLRRRMVDTIVRDIDVVSHASTSSEQAVFADSGHEIGSVTMIDAKTTNVSQIVAAAGDGGTVIVDGSLGELTIFEPVIIQTGQTLRSGGFQVQGSATGALVTVGSRAAIHGAASDENVIVVGSGATVRDLVISGGQNGIASDTRAVASTDLLGATISNNRVTGASINGVSFQNADVNTTISDNFVSENASNGFKFRSSSGNIISNTVESNGNDGFFFWNNQGNFENNIAISNRANGFEFADNTGSFKSNAAIRNGVAPKPVTNSGSFGISAPISILNSGNGFAFRTNLGSFEDNDAIGNSNSGFEFFENRSAFTGNVASDNKYHGFNVENNHASMTANKSSGNLSHGFEINLISETGNVSFNSATNNGWQGYSVGENQGVFSDNVSSNNDGD